MYSEKENLKQMKNAKPFKGDINKWNIKPKL